MKRACPFDANLLRMTKVHLMDHDVDSNALNKLYDDTLLKLMNGAKQKMPLVSVEIQVSAGTNNPCEKSMRQTSMTSFVDRIRCDSNQNFKPAVQRLCPSSVSCCAYCDKQKETVICQICGEEFCHACSLSRYSQHEEQYVCISCS